jgi:hypothetical protein
MKLVIVTVVDDYIKEVSKLFKKAGIATFSQLDIAGYKSRKANDSMSGWFATRDGGANSEMFFSFAEETHITALFQEIKVFNSNLESNNPVRAVVVPIEQFI